MATEHELLNKEKIAETKRELQRRSLDQIAVYNPLDTDFQTIYDGFTHVAPAKAESVFPRYIAEKMMREYTDYMINNEEQLAVEKENKKRAAKGWKPLNPEEKNDFVSAHSLLTSDEDKRYKYTKEMYRGISKEHGLDMVSVSPATKLDKRPTDVKTLERLDREMGTVLPEYDLEEVEVEEKKEELLRELDD